MWTAIGPWLDRIGAPDLKDAIYEATEDMYPGDLLDAGVQEIVRYRVAQWLGEQVIAGKLPGITRLLDLPEVVVRPSSTPFEAVVGIEEP